MAQTYRIRIQGHLDAAWAEELAGLELTHCADGTTRLQGAIVDQAALRGILNQLNDLGVVLLEVVLLSEPGPS